MEITRRAGKVAGSKRFWLLLFIVGVICFWFRAGCSAPSLKVEKYLGTADNIGWYIINTDEQPITVTKVTLNGEFEAPPATLFLGVTIRVRGDKEEPQIPGIKSPFIPNLPISLTIGEKQLFAQQPSFTSGYKKEIVFIDVETDRGTLRVKPSDRK